MALSSPFEFSISDLVVKLKHTYIELKFTEDIIYKIVRDLRNEGKVKKTKRGRYKRSVDMIEPGKKFTKNWSLVLNSIEKLGEATTDDVENDIGLLPNRGVPYAFSALKKRGYIEYIQKHANGKGVYRVAEIQTRNLDNPATAKKAASDNYVEVFIQNGNPTVRLHGNPSKETISKIFDELKRAV